MGRSAGDREPDRANAVKQPQRKAVVFSTLVGVLTLTSALLLALSPAPLRPHAASNLYAAEAPGALDVIFDTQTPTQIGRWRYIFVRHSLSPSGSAFTLSQPGTGLGDHFVIGNGNGAIDGEIQMGQRWNEQVSAAPPPGATEIDPACISICLVGDFDQTVPTPTQLRRLGQLVATLQGRFQIGADQVLLMDLPGSSSGIGKYFPATAFREQLLP